MITAKFELQDIGDGKSKIEGTIQGRPSSFNEAIEAEYLTMIVSLAFTDDYSDYVPEVGEFFEGFKKKATRKAIGDILSKKLGTGDLKKAIEELLSDD